jgi:hypothetical protein
MLSFWLLTRFRRIISAYKVHVTFPYVILGTSRFSSFPGVCFIHILKRHPQQGAQQTRGSIQNIPDWCRDLYSSCGSIKNLSQKPKLWTPGSTATFRCDCVKTCEDVAPKFGQNRPGCFTMTTPRLTLPYSPSIFWRNKIWLSSPTHRALLIWHHVTSSYFRKWNCRWKDAGLIILRRSSPNLRVLDTLAVNDFQEAFQKGRRWDQCSGVPKGSLGGFNPPSPKFRLFTKVSQIPSSVENASVTT